MSRALDAYLPEDVDVPGADGREKALGPGIFGASVETSPMVGGM